MGEVITLRPKGIGRAENMDKALEVALDWILRFGVTTREVLKNSLFSGPQVLGVDRLLMANRWVREIPCCSSCSDTALVLSEEGLQRVADRYDRPIPYPELSWDRCDEARCDDLLWGQQLTAANLRGGALQQFWTPRMLRSDEPYPFPDIEWLMSDGRLLAVNVDGGSSFSARHTLCTSMCIREGISPKRYDREALVTNEYAIIEDYHQRLKPGSKLPIWEPDPGDFTPIDYVEVPDFDRRLCIFLADPWGEVFIA